MTCTFDANKMMKKAAIRSLIGRLVAEIDVGACLAIEGMAATGYLRRSRHPLAVTGAFPSDAKAAKPLKIRKRRRPRRRSRLHTTHYDLRYVTVVAFARVTVSAC